MSEHRSDAEVCVWFNPGCSKCRGARDLLAGRGVDAQYLRYLDDRPSADDIRRVMGLLGIDDPRLMMRTNEAVYRQLGLAGVHGQDLIAAMVEHPVLIERPIVIRGGRAVIARPPEKLLALLD